MFTKKNMKLLHVAPEFCFARKFHTTKNISYTSIDLGYGLAEFNEDVTMLKFKSETFDSFIILHVLEHIQNEQSALTELYRVLKPGGWGILQVPMDLSSEKTIEDSSANTPEKRLAAFGQNDHVRLYGLDLSERLESVGFKVTYVNMWNDMADSDRIRYKVSKDEPFYLLKKNH
ncbi:MAG TPA: class I SAM-dependent methyltransferase [Chitinispirillaceae bacterium]|nr:class I SAM-dependent methyltransferase [Chitinispirillaceae bacterium]